MNKTKNKSRALKNTANESGFFRALLFGFLSCLVTWIILAVVFSFVMSKQTDSTSLSGILSPITVVVSLAVGGFVAGKTDKSCAALSSFVLGCAVLGICYCLSVSLDLTKQLSAVMKTIAIAVMLVCPLVGARFAVREKKKKTNGWKRM